MSLFKNTSSGSHSSLLPTISDTLDEVEKSSEESLTIDSEVKAKLDDFDEQFNWLLKLKKNTTVLYFIYNPNWSFYCTLCRLVFIFQS